MDAARRFDLALLTVIGAELRAVQGALAIDNTRDRFGMGGDIFWQAHARSAIDSTEFSIVIHCLGKPGEQEAAAAATKVIERFSPKMLILAGIAAGRRDKVKIGDVAIPRSVVDTTLKVAEGGKLIGRPKIPPLPHVVSQMVAAFSFDIENLRERSRTLFAGSITAPAGQESEYERHVAAVPNLHEVAIASDDVLLRDPNVLTGLAANVHQQIRIGEMEAAGLVTACDARHPQIPWFVVRGVSDFGDELKGDDFHRLAAVAAASYVAYFLEAGIDPALLKIGEHQPIVAKVSDHSAALATPAPSAAPSPEVTQHESSGASGESAKGVYPVADKQPASKGDSRSANPFQKSGTLSPQKPSYVTRGCDGDLESGLQKYPLIVLCGDYGIGKSSLLLRIKSQWQNQNTVCHVTLEGARLDDAKSFNEYFFKRVTRQLAGATDWDELCQVSEGRPSLLIIDEIGVLTPMIATQFIAGLYHAARSRHNDLRIVVCLSKYRWEDFLEDRRVGNPKYRREWHPINMLPFNDDEVKTLLNLLPDPVRAIAHRRLSDIIRLSYRQPQAIQSVCFELFSAAKRDPSGADFDQIILSAQSYS